MSTLVIKSSGVISNPKYGKIKSVNEGARIVLDARTLSLINGATVDNWRAIGSGSVNERTFSSKTGTWAYPTFSNAARKSVKFSGNEMIANNVEIDDVVTTATYVVVAKFDELSADVENRLFVGSVNTPPNVSYQSVYPVINGVAMKGDGDSTGKVSSVGTDWFVGVFVFDGASSKFITTKESEVVDNPRVASSQDRISLGGNVNKYSSSSKGMKGDISFFAQYDRALSNQEMIDTMRYYKEQFAV